MVVNISPAAGLSFPSAGSHLLGSTASQQGNAAGSQVLPTQTTAPSVVCVPPAALTVPRGVV